MRHRISKPSRSHRSKKERKKKTKTRIITAQLTSVRIGTGFLERVRRPKVVGKSIKSMTMRVDAEFGAWLRAEAKKGKPVTEITRDIYEALREQE